MMARLMLIMTIVPLIELYLMVQLSAVTSVSFSIATVLLTGVLGGYLAKREGLSLLNQLRSELRQGLPPAERLVEGLLVLVGAVLLITPGVLSDITGLLIILPPVRRRLAPPVKTWLLARVDRIPGLRVGPLGPGPAAREEPAPRARFQHPVS